MSKPTSRAEFKEYCLRKLGKGAIDINVTEDQIDDRVDQALSYYADYHFDATDKIYYKYQVTGKEKPGAANTVVISSGGTLYSNTDTITISGGRDAEGTINTYANGTIQSIEITEPGAGYSNTDIITINTSTGSGANTNLIVGDGSFTLPENIIGTVRIFPVGDPSMSSTDFFNIRYQIALNDLYTLTSVSLVPYYMVMEHLALIQELLVGQQPIRFSRHKNKIYVDTDWRDGRVGNYLIVEAYEVIDPEVYKDVWKDRWLAEYCSALIQEQWGHNVTKYTGMVLPGGVQFNGDRILTDAQRKIEKMEEEMISSYSLPVSDFIG